ncbi:MAG: IS110 family transposase [Actinobacteria bacterium]|nr:IS110 family transposase [Actinomycetota bacterium]
MTALALTVERGDWGRFRPQSLGPFLGLTPNEDSSGERRRLGAITKTGNTHARRLLVEAVWHQRRLLRASVALVRAPPGPVSCGPRPGRCERPSSTRTLGKQSKDAASGARSSPSPSLESWPATAGRWRRWRNRASSTARRGERTGAEGREERPRYSYEQPLSGDARL